ncbi:hypothetical protein HPHPP23_0877 [Helicobacter pylori Hp P-23]|uniref:Uncharacterized protein n=2 Tax=Helicobacter pylori TaxID=210 RepID=A0AAW9KJU2_HELPX|nr:hypothetical protein [Helicobacter pylori]EJB52588.1 hypothetical protein HPHPH27_1135 [Helicobacter pylori Hp H-27]EJC04190.1 hypothetical protein HPHPP4_0667 [Helicobacter pylori Hp P-4]EJC12619.1 hypothetical protein HPHPP23_0877 [Helicobacter pylori Hp P-23]EJC16346.1 hypothetical protein HPHPP74_1157 [Helicobacter pylori Hp P-74]EJC23655.1 hypothetical protein HPHPP4D_0703 [Helicobacter pylori Hp P-4d]
MSSLSNLFFHSLFFIKSNPSQLLKGWGSKIFFINRKFALTQYNPSVLIFILLNRAFGVCV